MPKLPEPFQRGKVFYFSYVDEAGRRRQRSTGCTTKKDAREEIERFFAQPGSHITLGAFASDFFVPGKCPWLAAKQKGKKKLKPAQIRNKRNHLTKWILPKWERWNLEAITPRKYRDWLYSLSCKAQTQRHIHYTMQAILQEAVIADAVSRNVAKEVAPPSVDDAEHRDAFTAQEMLELFPHSPLDIERHMMLEADEGLQARYGQRVGLRVWETVKYYVCAELMAHTGLREGEAVSLTWGNIVDDTWLVLTQSKTGKPKVIYLVERIRELLQLWRGASIWIEQDDWLFFGTDRSNHVANSTMSKVTAAAIKRAGIKPAGRSLGAHSLRVTYNTRLRRLIPDDILRIQTGHVTKAMTELYDKSQSEAMIEALRGYSETIERALG